VTDGPYVLGQWIKGCIIIYRSTPYYDKDKVNIDQIYCYMIVDKSTALAMYKDGKLDVVRIARSEITRVKASPSLRKELHIAQ